MTPRKVYITAASWEPRFILGAQRIFADHKFSAIICFWFEEFGERTEQTRHEFAYISRETHVKMVPLPLYQTDITNKFRTIPAYATLWKRIKETLKDFKYQFDAFVLDISTMPREAIWIILDLLNEDKIPGLIVYHRADSHGDWCGADLERPHIVPKLGGLPTLNQPTKMLIVSGYDCDRSEQFITSYEPIETLILFQQFPNEMNADNREKNEQRHIERFGGRGKSITLRGFNCYEPDWGLSQISAAVELLSQNSNVILASLGPKISAIPLYQAHRRFQESCLVYSPCRSYNEDYSSGIGKTESLQWNLGEIAND